MHVLLVLLLYYSSPIGERSIAISVFVCLCVCLSDCLLAYLGNRWTDLREFLVQIPCGRGFVLLWRRCDMLCTSGFMDDVTFGTSGPYGDAWEAEP